MKHYRTYAVRVKYNVASRVFHFKPPMTVGKVPFFQIKDYRTYNKHRRWHKKLRIDWLIENNFLQTSENELSWTFVKTQGNEVYFGQEKAKG